VKVHKLFAWLAAAAAFALALVVVVFVPVDAGITEVRTEADIARARGEVYQYVTTPANWPRWHPSSVAVIGDATHSLVVGESVVEEFKVAGQHGFVTWRVIGRETDRLWRIEGQIDGHLAGVITYTLSDKDGGTHFDRQFEYPSRTLLFAILNALTLRERVIAESEQALAQLRTVLDTKP